MRQCRDISSSPDQTLRSARAPASSATQSNENCPHATATSRATNIIILRLLAPMFIAPVIVGRLGRFMLAPSPGLLAAHPVRRQCGQHRRQLWPGSFGLSCPSPAAGGPATCGSHRGIVLCSVQRILVSHRFWRFLVWKAIRRSSELKPEPDIDWSLLVHHDTVNFVITAFAVAVIPRATSPSRTSVPT